jgi:hypothetical protein
MGRRRSSGWGPSGRRFKSCLPDSRKPTSEAGFGFEETRPQARNTALFVTRPPTADALDDCQEVATAPDLRDLVAIRKRISAVRGSTAELDLVVDAVVRAKERIGFRHLQRWVGAALIALAAVLGPRGVAGESTPSGSRGHIPVEFASKRYGYTGVLPVGWQRARHRLVPRLLNPREILSLGTFAMPVGGGGDCGREPIAAIDRMHPGDAVITIQETAETGAMKRRLDGGHPLPSQRQAVPTLQLRRELHAPSEHVSTAQELWYSQLSFATNGRWLDALVYVKGTPTSTRLGQIRMVLRRIQFVRGTFVRFP